MIKKVENCGRVDQFNCTAFPTPVSVPLQRMIELFGVPVKEYFCLMAEFEDGEDEGLIFAVVMPANKDSSVWNVLELSRRGIRFKIKQRLNKKLHELGVQYYQNGSWLLYAKYQDKGYTESETIKFNSKKGDTITKMVFKWTEEGRKFIHEKICGV